MRRVDAEVTGSGRAAGAAWSDAAVNVQAHSAGANGVAWSLDADQGAVRIPGGRLDLADLHIGGRYDRDRLTLDRLHWPTDAGTLGANGWYDTLTRRWRGRHALAAQARRQRRPAHAPGPRARATAR